MVQRVVASDAALALVAKLGERHGALMFYLSHGCCDGTTPLLLPQGEMSLHATDVQLGEVGGVPFHVSAMQYEYLSGSQQMLDVAPGSSGAFSLEDGEGVHFELRSRLFTDEEWAELNEARC